MKTFAKRMDNIIPSGSIAMAQRARNKGSEVIDLTWGQPDFDTMEHIKQAAYKAIASGKNGYTPSAGIPELREAIARFHADRYGARYDPNTEVLVTPGAKQGLMYILQLLIDQGDEVILFEPYWLSYRDMILLCGGIPKFIPALGGLIPDLEALKRAISMNTKAILINNPVNPSGYVFNRNQLQCIADYAENNDLFIISDEIYDRIVFTDFISASELKAIRDRLVIANGFSKTYAMTGWRIGYLLGCERIISKIGLIHQHTATCAAAPSQYAALAALEGTQITVDNMCRTYKERRDFLMDGLKNTPFSLVPPKGTFYAMLDVSDLDAPADKKSEKFLDKYEIASVNGILYGQSSGNYLRLSLTKEIRVLKQVVDRLLD